MRAMFNGIDSSVLGLEMSLDDFLGSGVMFGLALVNMCSPEDLVVDHIPASTDLEDDDEIAQVFGEAVVLASDHAVTNVRFDSDDLAFVKRRLMPRNDWHLVPTVYPELVA